MYSAKRNRPAAIEVWADTPILPDVRARMETRPVPGTGRAPPRGPAGEARDTRRAWYGGPYQALHRRIPAAPVLSHSPLVCGFFRRRRKTAPPPRTTRAMATPAMTGVALEPPVAARSPSVAGVLAAGAGDGSEPVCVVVSSPGAGVPAVSQSRTPLKFLVKPPGPVMVKS